MEFHEISTSNSTTMPEKEVPTLMALPTELHLLISQHLTYPDALSLKYTNSHFYSLVYTGVRLKIEWLIERRQLHLDCPNDKKCELGSDMRFCRGSVQYVSPSLQSSLTDGFWDSELVVNSWCRLLMKRRREHGECETRPGGRGCLVLGTPVCEVRREKMASEVLKRNMKGLLKGTAAVWWVLVALVGVLVVTGAGWALVRLQSMKMGDVEI